MKKTIVTVVADLLDGKSEADAHDMLSEALKRDNMKLAVVVAKYIRDNFWS